MDTCPDYDVEAAVRLCTKDAAGPQGEKDLHSSMLDEVMLIEDSQVPEQAPEVFEAGPSTSLTINVPEPSTNDAEARDCFLGDAVDASPSPVPHPNPSPPEPNKSMPLPEAPSKTRGVNLQPPGMQSMAERAAEYELQAHAEEQVHN